MKTEIDIDVTPDQLAEMFVSGWHSGEQAEFFNLIGKHFRSVDFDAEGQCCSMAQDVNRDGKDFLFTVANFVKSFTVPTNSPHQDHLLNAYDCDSLRRAAT